MERVAKTFTWFGKIAYSHGLTKELSFSFSTKVRDYRSLKFLSSQSTI